MGARAAPNAIRQRPVRGGSKPDSIVFDRGLKWGKDVVGGVRRGVSLSRAHPAAFYVTSSLAACLRGVPGLVAGPGQFVRVSRLEASPVSTAG